MAYGKSGTWDAIRELAFGGISETYAAVGSATNKALRIVKITNATNVTLYFSNDGLLDKLKLPSNSFQIWDVTANKAIENRPQFIEIGTVFSVRSIVGSDATSGWVSIEAFTVERGS